MAYSRHFKHFNVKFQKAPFVYTFILLAVKYLQIKQIKEKPPGKYAHWAATFCKDPVTNA